MHASSLDYHIIIVGGGIVGLTLACALAQNDLRIAIIEQKAANAHFNAAQYDLRVSAINHASEIILRNLKVWELIPRLSSYEQMRVWDAESNGLIEFSASAIGTPTLGHIIENQALLVALEQRVQQLPQITRLCPSQLTDVKISRDQVSCHFADHARKTAQVIIGADGKNSWLRQHLQIAIQEHDYHHTALVTTIKTAKPHQATAYQRFLPTGPLALLPFADPHLCSIVWSTTPEHSQQLLSLSQQDLATAITEASEAILGTISVEAKPLAFPLTMHHVQHYVSERVTLVGDALHSVHPLAGLGMNLGILDAACLAEVLLDAAKQQRDLGDMRSLRRYERWRKGDNTITLAGIGMLKNLFTEQSKPVSLFRAMGLNILNRTPFAKKIIIKKALGLIGELPKLATLIH